MSDQPMWRDQRVCEECGAATCICPQVIEDDKFPSSEEVDFAVIAVLRKTVQEQAQQLASLQPYLQHKRTCGKVIRTEVDGHQAFLAPWEADKATCTCGLADLFSTLGMTRKGGTETAAGRGGSV